MRLGAVSDPLRDNADAIGRIEQPRVAKKFAQLKTHATIDAAQRENCAVNALNFGLKIFFGKCACDRVLRAICANLRNFCEYALAQAKGKKFDRIARCDRKNHASARLSACAKRSKSASVFVSVAHTRSTFSNSGYSSPSAKPATIFSFASCSTMSCADLGSRIATS